MNAVVAPDLLDSALLAGAEYLDQPAVVGDTTWTWRQVHSASIAVAAGLNPDWTVCNLCDSRVGFLVIWLAALRRRCRQLLPPSGGGADLRAMLHASAAPCIIADDPSALRPEWTANARCMVLEPCRFQFEQLADSELAWAPAWNAELVCLYTSGTTGAPQPQAKTLSQLARGAQLLGVRLDEELDCGVTGLRSIVCSVPPQHMFGLEASVMLSLVHGIPIVEGRPLLPADVRTAFEDRADCAAWVTTPLHLSSMQRAGESLPNCLAVIASTMPLTSGLAAQAEKLARAPVLEIYGSTETGALAMRRTAERASWRPLSGVRLEPADHGTRAWGEHFASPQTLADLVAAGAESDFTLLGRESDLIKIAGRRASLAGLNQMLQELPGLVDGVFYMPASDAPTERLVLIYTGNGLDRRAAEAWLRERMDPVFLPRAFIRVDSLPRAAAGKLPRAALDEIYTAWRAKRRAV